MKSITIERDSYYDSVFLMLINREVRQISGVQDAVVAMGTEVNRSLLQELGFSAQDLTGARPNDLIIAVAARDREAVAGALEAAKELLHRKKAVGQADYAAYRPVGLDTAVQMLPAANLLIISVPGHYAAREARRALEQGLHVMLFSDHVSLEEEIALKKLAVDKGLLMMGPDCGTALINGKPLCFANRVHRGNIGIVAASGTGLQEVSCCVHRLGGGISQGIGTGGRDLQAEVGGRMMLMGIEALRHDPATRVMVLISKPPAQGVAGRVLERLRLAEKPSVVHFIGLEQAESCSPSSASGEGPTHPQTPGKVHFAGNLEEAAGLAVALSQGRDYAGSAFSLPEGQVAGIVARETAGISSDQRYLRGLYTGGTLADEALMLFQREVGGIYSNNQSEPGLKLQDPHRSREHTIVDLGDDLFTRGRPHPMIDPSIRVERIRREMEDPQVAVLLLDLVLGYGAHPDPAGPLVESLGQAKRRAQERGGYLAVIASVTGTPEDVQNLEAQQEKLESAGCVVMPSNAQAARLALRIIKRVA